MNILKSLLFTLILFALLLVAVVLVAKSDDIFGLPKFSLKVGVGSGVILLILGVGLRLWATWLFYKNRLKVISGKPQPTLVTSGPYQFSRNPLYLGIVFILFGAALLLGSFSAMLFSLAVFGLLNWWVRIEEKQLAAAFGKNYARYKKQVRRWM